MLSANTGACGNSNLRVKVEYPLSKGQKSHREGHQLIPTLYLWTRVVILLLHPHVQTSHPRPTQCLSSPRPIARAIVPRPSLPLFRTSCKCPATTSHRHTTTYIRASHPHRRQRTRGLTHLQTRSIPPYPTPADLPLLPHPLPCIRTSHPPPTQCLS